MNKKGIQKKFDFELVVVEAEPRVDSRLIARRLGIKHKNTIELIKRHQERFKNFGLLPFQTEAVEKKEALNMKNMSLNESQSIFLLTLSRNTEKVMDLKADLTRKFEYYRKEYLRRARQIRRQGQKEWQQARLESKIERRELTDQIKPHQLP